MSLALTIVTAVVLAATPVFAYAQSSVASKPTANASAEIKAGVYDLELAFGGGAMPGSLTIKRVTDDSLSVLLRVGEHEPPPIRKLVRDGSKLRIEAGAEGMSVIYDLQFAGEALNGKFTFNGDPGLVSGKLKK